MFVLTESQRLDWVRQKYGCMFSRAIQYLFSTGYDNLTEEMVLEIIRKVNENFDSGDAAIEEMEILLDRMNLLCVANEIRDTPLETLLDYIAEKGWGKHVRL